MKKQLVSLTVLFSFAIALFAPMHAADPGRNIQRQITMVQKQLDRVQEKIKSLEHESSAEYGKKEGFTVREVDHEVAQTFHRRSRQEMQRLLQLEHDLQQRLDTLRAQQ